MSNRTRSPASSWTSLAPARARRRRRPGPLPGHQPQRRRRTSARRPRTARHTQAPRPGPRLLRNLRRNPGHQPSRPQPGNRPCHRRRRPGLAMPHPRTSRWYHPRRDRRHHQSSPHPRKAHPLPRLTSHATQTNPTPPDIADTQHRDTNRTSAAQHRPARVRGMCARDGAPSGRVPAITAFAAMPKSTSLDSPDSC